jgi:TPR repeat protein
MTEPDAPANDTVAALERRAAAGDTKAMFDLGRLYDLPAKDGVPLDLERARHWYEKAADAGHAWAQFALGNIYDNAHGVPRNHRAARKWYEAAARQGVAEAQMHLGRMLQTGRGGAASPVEAAYWYELAAKGGHELAATNLALMHLADEAPGASAARALELLEFAADKLDGLAHLVLGDLYREGRAVARHGGLALAHYCVAVMLLPQGPNAERAHELKERFLAQRPDLREEYEAQAREFVAGRRTPGGDMHRHSPG